MGKRRRSQAGRLRHFAENRTLNHFFMKPNDILNVLKSHPGGRTSMVTFPVRNARLLAEGSCFFGKYTPDSSKAYVEFEICHSLPFVAGPAHVGGYAGFHPAALSRSHEGLRHQQTNLNHMLRAYDPSPDKKTIPTDRIIGAVVDTFYPEEPDGGWVVPESADAAIPMLVCGVVFKAAQGALDMLNKHVKKKETWSVSIECTCRDLSDLGIWIADKRELVPILQADDALLEKISRGKDGHIELGNDDSGNPLALCFGAIDGMIVFEGVGYTTRPAESVAEITSIRMSAESTPGMMESDFQFAEGLRRSWPSIWNMSAAVAGVPTSSTGFTIWGRLRASGELAKPEIGERKPESLSGKLKADWMAARAKVQTALEATTGAAAAVARLKWGLATADDLGVIVALKARRKKG